jgi:hypothetical protein
MPLFYMWLGKRSGAILAAVIVMFSGLATGLALTRRPWCDEGWFADIVYNLTHRGVMGLTILDPHGFIFAQYVKGIDQHTYWVLPGYIFAQSVWSSAFGLTPLTMRLLSTVWGIVALVSWYVVVRHLCQSRFVGLVAAAILALDQNFLLDGATGRMDMMCASLSIAGTAIYIQLRQKLDRAVLAASSVLAIALFTHPNALFGIILFALVVPALDWDRLRWRFVVIAALPFAFLLGLWLIYFLQAPDVAISQFRAQANIPHRFEVHLNPFRQFGDEIRGRYASGYHLYSSGLHVKAAGAVVLLYLAAVPAVLCVQRIRRLPGAMLIACFALISFALLSCLQSNAYYLVYTLPALSAALGLCIFALLQNRSVWSYAALIAIAGIVTLNLAPTLFRIAHNDYRHRFDAAIAFLKNNAGPNDLIMGSGELAFGLGFDSPVVDDCRLGYATGLRPQFIVLEGQYYTFWIPSLTVNEPRVGKFIRKLLDERYEIIYDQSHDPYMTLGILDSPYVIYRRKTESVEPD